MRPATRAATLSIAVLLHLISGERASSASMTSPTPSAAAATDGNFMVAVSEQLPTLDECYQFVAADPTCGAVATFCGITRDNFQGKKVKKLSYEGYVPMAIKELRKLCQEATGKYTGIQRIAAVHILGDCPVGRASVILACSSPHRRESLQCCEFLIDELKARIPIWKLEVYEGDEGSVWKENVEWHDGQRRRVMVQQPLQEQLEQRLHIG